MRRRGSRGRGTGKVGPGHFEPVPGIWPNSRRRSRNRNRFTFCAAGAEIIAEARRLVGHVPNVVLHDIPTNDAWMRDHGPMFLVGPPGSAPVLVDWGYNAWGGKLSAVRPRRCRTEAN